MARTRRVAAAERAVRAAEEPQPWLPPRFVWWALGRVLGLSVLVGAGWVVYDSASSDRFEVRSIHVHGNLLLSQAEIEQVAAVKGINVFWIDSAAVVERLRRLPLVQRADITPTLPDSVEVVIVERAPVAFWVSGGRSYLVDREGVILKPVDAEAQQVRACAGQPCDPRLAALPTVAQPDGQKLSPGDRVEASALVASARLAAVLPGLGVQPLGFEWSGDFGLEVPTRDGWRARFDPATDLERQVRALTSIRGHLASTRTAAQVIDVRFGDRPYYR
jgi:cell division septal protein FtsQ